MDKETSSRVSSIAGTILNSEPATDNVPATQYNYLLDQAKTLAGSALSQDETPGQMVSRSSDIKNFQILIHPTNEGISFGCQWSNRAYNASIPNEPTPATVVQALDQLGVLITHYELENDNAE